MKSKWTLDSKELRNVLTNYSKAPFIYKEFQSKGDNLFVHRIVAPHSCFIFTRIPTFPTYIPKGPTG